MKKLIYLFLGLLIVACATDDNNNDPQDVTPEFVWTQNWDGAALSNADLTTHYSPTPMVTY